MKIFPSILTDDPQHLKWMVGQAETFTDWVQIDIMDGEFVPSKSISASHLEEVRTSLNMEVHLMVNRPQQYLQPFKRAGAKRIAFHLEAANRPEEIIKQAKGLNLPIGLALNPETGILEARHLLDKVSFILFLSVNPGFYGSPFIPGVLDKVRQLKSLAPHLETGIDGGIKADNIVTVKACGVDYACVGSAIFHQPHPKESFLTLQRLTL